MGEFVEFEADAIISCYQIGERPQRSNASR